MTRKPPLRDAGLRGKEARPETSSAATPAVAWGAPRPSAMGSASGIPGLWDRRGAAGANAPAADGGATGRAPARASTGFRLLAPISGPRRLGGDAVTSPTEPTTEVRTSCMPLMTSEAGAPTMGTVATTAVTVALRLSREVIRVSEIDPAAFGTEAAASGTVAAAFGIEVAVAVGRPALRRPGVRAWPVPAMGLPAMVDCSRPGFRPAVSAPAMSRTAFRNVSVLAAWAAALVRLAGTLGRVSSGHARIADAGEGNRAPGTGDE